MIRREIVTQSGQALWLLISQVEHARISGELARNWREDFTSDVIEAIAHHDDGWGPWEAEPKLNPEFGAPFSFLEMPVPAAAVIWDHSIAAAGEYGPLAAYIVAGHFYNLLNKSEHANEPLATAWLTAKRKHRTGWLDEWIRASPSNLLDYAKRSQEMLLTTDLFSLWLCCECPIDTDHSAILAESPMKLQIDVLLGQFQFAVERFESDTSEDGRLDRLTWTVGVQPYPCQRMPLLLTAKGTLAPRKSYASWPELQAASWPAQLEWQLAQTAETNGSIG